MANNTSDYKKPRTNLNELLPFVFRNKTSESVNDNIFNRYLTKSELIRSYGSIGKKNTQLATDDRIEESSVLRQAWQLQPLMYSKNATVETIIGWKDILNKAARMGIDEDRLPVWGDALQFNFAPPIDPDKLTNFRDYYWYDPADPTSKPQYIVIKNKCHLYTAQMNVLQARYDQRVIDSAPQAELDQLLADITIIEVLRNYACSGTIGWGISPWDDSMGVRYESQGVPNDTFTLPYTWPGPIAEVVVHTLSSGIEVNKTTLSPLQYSAIGTTLTIFPALTLYNPITNTGDLVEVTNVPWFYEVYPGVAPPVAIPTPTDPYAWYDTTVSKLKRWDSTIAQWIIMNPQPTGNFPWDASLASSMQLNPWIVENKWVHRADLPSLSGAQPASLPIIEYNTFVEMNDTTYTRYRWMYRSTKSQPWSETDSEPSATELYVRYPIAVVDTINQFIEIQYDAQVASQFISGFKFAVDRVSGSYSDANINSTIWTVSSSLQVGANLRIFTNETINGSLVTVGYNIIPLATTSIGDAWAGFLTHWMLLSEEYPIPTSPQVTSPANYQSLRTEEFTVATTYAGVNRVVEHAVTVNNVTGVFTYTIPPNAQEFIAYTDVPVVLRSSGTPGGLIEDSTYYLINVTATTFQVSLTQGGPAVTGFVAPTGGLFVRPTIIRLMNTSYSYDSNNIRVYINGIRQYGTYEEGTKTSLATAFNASLLQYDQVNAIRFLENFPSVGDTIHVETFAVAQTDVGRESVSVRTTQTNTFTPTTRPLIQYRREEQVKVESNQYPLFNLYNPDGTSAFKASPIFIYEEDPSYSVNALVGKRIKYDVTTRDYFFQHFLVDIDTEQLYCYKDQEAIEPSNSTGLSSIWKKGANNERYVPRYINEYRLADGDSYVDSNGDPQVASVPPGSGDWEIPNQLFFNAEHELRDKISYRQLFTHYKTIIGGQTMPSPFDFVTQDGIRLLETVNYGVGGTIREHNDSFDTFLSALYQPTINPISLFEFAERQYVDLLRYVKDFFVQNYGVLLTDTSVSAMTNFNATLNDAVINSVTFNDLYDRTFGDSSAWSEANDTGIKSWIATLPMFKLLFKVRPYLIKDDRLGFFKLVHHDGHYTDISLDRKFKESFIQTLVDLTTGFSQPTMPTYSQVTQGVYWYDTSTQQLNRFSVVAIQSLTPSTLYPVGSYWLNNSTGILYQLNSTPVWVPVTGIPGDIDAAWITITPIEDLFASIFLEIENRLFTVTPPSTTTAFDFSSLVATPAEQQTYQEYFRDYFFEYVSENELNPTTVGYVATDAFTWNYNTVNTSNVVYPTAQTAITQPWGSTTYDIYLSIFNTPYPHREPWKLQGYNGKPTWWDVTYRDITNTRVWIATMWTNIQSGIVPIGQLLPSGVISTGAVGEVVQYSHVCVNTSNITYDGYGPDDLLPPYYANLTYPTLVNQTLIRNISYINFNDLANDVLFGDGGPAERQWRESINFLYDAQKVAFRMQPVRYLHYTFGPSFIDVAGLQVSRTFKKVYSHTDTYFHGDVLSDGMSVVNYRGLNQWYANYLRYFGMDSGLSSFIPLWKDWSPILSYQTDTVMNDESLEAFTANFNINNNDYAVTVKRSEGIETVHTDSIRVSVVAYGSYNVAFNARIPRGDGMDWTFQLAIPTLSNKDVEYYGIQNYAVTVDSGTDIFTSVSDTPWTTGQVVYLSTISGQFPQYMYDSETYATNDITPYYVIALTPTTFRLAHSESDAYNNISMNVVNVGSDVFVGAVDNIFVAFDAQRTSVRWRKYKADRAVTNTVRSPFNIIGIQSVLNFFYGYVAYQQDKGFVFNNVNQDGFTELDFETGRPVSWQVEIERLINQIYTGLGTRITSLDGTTQSLQMASYEVNPFRRNLWFSPEYGIVSDIFDGLVNDITAKPSIYDQNGLPLLLSQVSIARKDLISQIYLDESFVPTNPADLYKSRHIGGAQLYLDGFEHVILFNDYTLDNDLLYDSFLGLQTGKITLSFMRHPYRTGRPNVGGFFVSGTQIVENFEQATDGVRTWYDTYTVDETSDFLPYARMLLNYDDLEYLRDININPKSRFVFYRGMIQAKGSNKAIDAFLNQKQFQGATLDEYWAYSIGKFGDSKERVLTPQIKTKISDVYRNQLRYHFVTDESSLTNTTFQEIELSDLTRWADHPNVLQTIQNRFGNMVFDADIRVDSSDIITTPTGDYIKLNRPSDSVVIVTTTNTTVTRLTEGIDYTRINAQIIKFIVTPTDPITVYSIIPSRDHHNALKFYDSKSKTITDLVTVWDPARNYHFYSALPIVDTYSDMDPAIYNVIRSEGTQFSNDEYWSPVNEGTVWFDISTLGYVPYYDSTIFSSVDKRVEVWGKLADYASVNLYQWTKSSIPPEKWENRVTEQANDLSIPQEQKASGEAYKHLYVRIRSSEDDLFGDTWSVVPKLQRQVYFVALRDVPTSVIFNITEFTTYVGDQVRVYVNGTYQKSYTVVGGTVTVDFIPNITDTIELHKIIPTTDEEVDEFNENNPLVEYMFDYPYAAIERIDDTNTTIVDYYFWIKNKQAPVRSGLPSLEQAAAILTNPQTPYAIVGNLTHHIPSSSTVVNDPAHFYVPYYVELIITNIENRVRESDRLNIRFTRDLTLRDTWSANPDLDNVHKEWLMFREKQRSQVDISLWNKLIETMIGYSLTDVNIPIPSLNRVIYDSVYETVTRFGLNSEQAMAEKQQVIDTVIAEIQDDNYDIYPVDRDVFFATFSFDTPANIITAMNYVYNDFPVSAVNRIFFSVLNDMLAVVPFVPELFKTSYVSLSVSRRFILPSEVVDA